MIPTTGLAIQEIRRLGLAARKGRRAALRKLLRLAEDRLRAGYATGLDAPMLAAIRKVTRSRPNDPNYVFEADFLGRRARYRLRMKGPHGPRIAHNPGDRKNCVDMGASGALG